MGTIVAGLPANADDLDVYRSHLESQKKPNILFVLDYSGSMGRDVNGNIPPASGQLSKMEILKQAVRKVLDENTDTINAGIGNTYGRYASGARWPVGGLTDDAREFDTNIPRGTFTNRDIIDQLLDRREVGGFTATTNALAEAALYFRGGRVANGDTDPEEYGGFKPDVWDPVAQRHLGGNENSAMPATYSPKNAYRNGEWTNANYISPIESECATNAIVLVSDGNPTRLYDNEALREVIGMPASACEDLKQTIFATSDSTDDEGNCAKEVAYELANNPQIRGNPGSTVKTFTIGFSIDDTGAEYLDQVARAGDGESATAENLEQLNEALKSFIGTVRDEAQTFVELSIDVDRANFSHEDRAYFNLFKPNTTASWQGNTKGFFMTAEGLKDVNGRDAVNAAGTGFVDKAQSFWSANADGNKVERGGVSEQMSSPATPRNLYTALSHNNSRVELAGSKKNRIAVENGRLNSRALGLGGGSRAQREEVLNWVQTASMGDPLHTLPVTVSYHNREVLFTMTNQGFVHAIDVTTPESIDDADNTGGEEIFAFMPERLLSNLPKVAQSATAFDHVYGMDGGITRVHDDADGDGIVDSGDSVTLFVGMRRGGDSYYALDVTDPERPALVKSIDPQTPDFASLGETWSRMALVNGRSGTADERFLVFSGGYDADKLDGTSAPTPTDKGNAIYVIDTDGDLVWSVDGRSEPRMKYAITADPTIIDTNADGRADRMYVGDLGGQIWRVDFDDMRAKASYKVTLLAQLANLGSDEFQPFFYSPSVSLNSKDGVPFIAVALGSGDRTDPMNTVSSNRLYMVRDTNVETGPPAAASVITTDMLYDATANLINSSDEDTAQSASEQLRAANGWYVHLEPGEKSLSDLVTFEGNVLATTFEPGLGEAGACGVDPIGRYYRMDVATGAPGVFAHTASSTGTTDNPERFEIVPTLGIPSSPSVVFTESGLTQIYVGLNRVEETESQLSRIFWHAR